jgi:hypothetical protein
MRYFITILALTFCGITYAQSDTLKNDQDIVSVQVLMKSVSGGDFDFHEKWSYPEGVYVNQWGQLSCDGLCPIEIDRMIDSSGRIYDNSLSEFYQIIDTTHLYHTLKSEAQVYEFVGTDFIDFQRTENGVVGVTKATIATHSVLTITIENGQCTAWINFNSIRAGTKIERFKLTQGRVLIDKESFENGEVKGSFDFRFENHLDPNYPIWWKGSIYAPIEE